MGTAVEAPEFPVVRGGPYFAGSRSRVEGLGISKGVCVCVSFLCFVVLCCAFLIEKFSLPFRVFGSIWFRVCAKGG